MSTKSLALLDEVASLLPHCGTYRQTEVLNTVLEEGNVSAAARKLGVVRCVVQGSIRDVRARAAKSSKHVPPGHTLVGLSTLTRTEDNEPQWIKTKASVEQEKLLFQEAREAALEGLKREKAVPKKKQKASADLLNLYLITDFHLGMKAWREETGGDWDLKIAEDLILGWFMHSIRYSPASSSAIFAQMGDFLHWDGVEAVTPASKHLLDADTRFQKLVRVAIKVIRRVTRALLEKHDTVHLIHAEGNHDPASSMWLREMFNILYEDEPRVTVDLSPDPYYCYEFGQTGLFFHHGHKRKPASIDDVFVAKFREVFGRTSYCYGHTGHLHHNLSLETNLMQIEQHQTLASPDAFASRGGWLAGRSSKVLTYHRDYGEVGRISVTPEMVYDGRRAQKDL